MITSYYRQLFIDSGLSFEVLHQDDVDTHLDLPIVALWPAIVRWAYRHIYSQPYVNKTSEHQGFPRPIHGIQHVTRVSLYVKALAHLYSYFKDNEATELSNIDLFFAQVSALFHDAARKDDGEDRWDFQSAEMLFYFLTEKLDVDQVQAGQLAENVANKDSQQYWHHLRVKSDQLSWSTEHKQSSSPILQKLLHDADALDIMRCRNCFRSEYLYFYHDYAQHDSSAWYTLAQLVNDVRYFIHLHGDSCHDSHHNRKLKFDQPECYAQSLKLIHSEGGVHNIEPRLRLLRELITGASLSALYETYDPDAGITEANINAAMQQGRLLLRASESPVGINKQQSGEKTHAQVDVSKVLRPQGNPSRSCSLAGYGAFPASRSGFIKLDPDVNHIHTIKEHDFASGCGKKRHYYLFHAFSQGIQAQWNELIKTYQKGGCVPRPNSQAFHRYSEWVVDFDHYDGVFYTENPTVLTFLAKKPNYQNAALIEAIYLNKLYQAYLPEAQRTRYQPLFRYDPYASALVHTYDYDAHHNELVGYNGARIGLDQLLRELINDFWHQSVLTKLDQETRLYDESSPKPHTLVDVETARYMTAAELVNCCLLFNHRHDLRSLSRQQVVQRSFERFTAIFGDKTASAMEQAVSHFQNTLLAAHDDYQINRVKQKPTLCIHPNYMKSVMNVLENVLESEHSLNSIITRLSQGHEHDHRDDNVYRWEALDCESSILFDVNTSQPLVSRAYQYLYHADVILDLVTQLQSQSWLSRIRTLHKHHHIRHVMAKDAYLSRYCLLKYAWHLHRLPPQTNQLVKKQLADMNEAVSRHVLASLKRFRNQIARGHSSIGSNIEGIERVDVALSAVIQLVLVDTILDIPLHWMRSIQHELQLIFNKLDASLVFGDGATVKLIAHLRQNNKQTGSKLAPWLLFCRQKVSREYNTKHVSWHSALNQHEILGSSDYAMKSFAYRIVWQAMSGQIKQYHIIGGLLAKVAQSWPTLIKDQALFDTISRQHADLPILATSQLSHQHNRHMSYFLHLYQQGHLFTLPQQETLLWTLKQFIEAWRVKRYTFYNAGQSPSKFLSFYRNLLALGINWLDKKQLPALYVPHFYIQGLMGLRLAEKIFRTRLNTEPLYAQMQYLVQTLQNKLMRLLEHEPELALAQALILPQQFTRLMEALTEDQCRIVDKALSAPEIDDIACQITQLTDRKSKVQSLMRVAQYSSAHGMLIGRVMSQIQKLDPGLYEKIGTSELPVHRHSKGDCYIDWLNYFRCVANHTLSLWITGQQTSDNQVDTQVNNKQPINVNSQFYIFFDQGACHGHFSLLATKLDHDLLNPPSSGHSQKARRKLVAYLYEQSHKLELMPSFRRFRQRLLWISYQQGWDLALLRTLYACENRQMDKAYMPDLGIASNEMVILGIITDEPNHFETLISSVIQSCEQSLALECLSIYIHNIMNKISATYKDYYLNRLAQDSALSGFLVQNWYQVFDNLPLRTHRYCIELWARHSECRVLQDLAAQHEYSTGPLQLTPSLDAEDHYTLTWYAIWQGQMAKPQPSVLASDGIKP